MPNPSAITPELISQLSLTPDGQYYTGSVNETFFAFSTEEVVATLGDAYAFNPDAEAKQLAADGAGKSQVGTGIFVSVEQYTTGIKSSSECQPPEGAAPILECSEAHNPMNDPTIFQSVLPDSPEAKRINAAKLRAQQWAEQNNVDVKELLDDAELLTSTATTEARYVIEGDSKNGVAADPSYLDELLAESGQGSKEAALVLATEILSDEDVNADVKASVAQSTHQFLKSSDAQYVVTEVAETSYQAVVIFYTDNPQIAEEQGVELNVLRAEVGSSFKGGAEASDINTFDDSLPATNQMGMASSSGADGAQNAAPVDPVALTTETLKEQNAIAAVTRSDEAESVATASSASAFGVPSTESEGIETPVAFNGWVANESSISVPLTHPDPVIQYADFALLNSHPLSSLAMELSFSSRALPAGIALYHSVASSSSTVTNEVEARNSITLQQGSRPVLVAESGALQVHGETATLVAQRAEDQALDQQRIRAISRRLNQPFFETPAFCSAEGGLCLWQGEIKDGDATTMAGLIATDPNVGAFAGMQSATVSAFYFPRGNTPLALAGITRQDVSVQKTASQADSGAHQGNGEDREHRDSQGRPQDDSRHAWYDPAEDEAETKAA